jgi:phosphoribosylamine--glycine ligase
VIENIENSEKEGNILFYAGVREQNGELVVSGGRVLHSVGTDNELGKAREKAYKNLQNIHFEGMFYRDDIAL